MRKIELAYNQSNNKREILKSFKKREGYDFKRRKFKPFNTHKIYQKNTFKDKNTPNPI